MLKETAELRAGYGLLVLTGFTASTDGSHPNAIA